jgi:hypothetical protein
VIDIPVTHHFCFSSSQHPPISHTRNPKPVSTRHSLRVPYCKFWLPTSFQMVAIQAPLCAWDSKGWVYWYTTVSHFTKATSASVSIRCHLGLLVSAQQVALRASCQVRAQFSSWTRMHLLEPLKDDVSVRSVRCDDF